MAQIRWRRRDREEELPMKERGIIFTAENVRAILEGRKTQTRRVVSDRKLTPKVTLVGLLDFLGGGGKCDGTGMSEDDEGLRVSFVQDFERTDCDTGKKHRYTGLLVQSEAVPGDGAEEIPCPYGMPGDRLWVRETWIQLDAPISQLRVGDRPRIAYRADHPERSAFDGRCRSPIHMPRWASRITLEVISVNVERLQEIDEADALAEGIDDAYLVRHKLASDQRVFAYRMMWDEINGPEHSWEKNPWVWVVEFKRLASDQRRKAA